MDLSKFNEEQFKGLIKAIKFIGWAIMFHAIYTVLFAI